MRRTSNARLSASPTERPTQSCSGRATSIRTLPVPRKNDRIGILSYVSRIRTLNFFFANRRVQQLLDLLDIDLFHAIAPPVLAFQRIDNVLPHRARRLQIAGPLAAALQFP